jgi:hypothetical protein
MNWKYYGRKWSWHNLRHYLGISEGFDEKHGKPIVVGGIWIEITPGSSRKRSRSTDFLAATFDHYS